MIVLYSVGLFGVTAKVPITSAELDAAATAEDDLS